MQAEPCAGQRHTPPQQHQEYDVRKDGREQRHLIIVRVRVSAVNSAPWSRVGARGGEVARRRKVAGGAEKSRVIGIGTYLADGSNALAHAAVDEQPR